jgi:pyridoxamine 5'-phosphate oxidase
LAAVASGMPDDSSLSTLDAYEGEQLPSPLPDDPFALFRAWFDDARARMDQPNPNAMTLATVDADGRPSGRVVLCKGIEESPGCILFYTNYESRKGEALAANPCASLTFHWDHTDRQVRIEGPVTRTTPEESDAYFRTRRWESRLGAWSSDQSRPIESRDALLEKVTEKVMELGLDLSKIVDGQGEELDIPRPPHWGGFRVWAERMELWVGGTGRVHDRAAWTRTLTKQGEAYEVGAWESTRLQP